MPSPIQYDPSAALHCLKKRYLREIEKDLEEARQETLDDVPLLTNGKKIPKSKRPLDSGFIELPRNLLDEAATHGGDSLLGRIRTAAETIRGEVDRFVVLGIGGSYMGARALFEALCHSRHNELSRTERYHVPRIYFEGNNLDNDTLAGLLELLQNHCRDKSDVNQRWGLTVISKSGGTIETAVAFRLFREALEGYYGTDSDESRRFIIPVTGEIGKLRDLSNLAGYHHVFPVPDGVGGRYSIFTAVGLLPAAVMGLNIELLLQGAADMTERFRTAPVGDNPVLDYVGLGHVFEEEYGLNIRLFSTWGARLEAVGLWYDQLLSESLGKDEQGATPITVVNTRDLHSRGQQHQEGRRDKLITNVIVQQPSWPPLRVPHTATERDRDQLNQYSSKTIPELLTAAIAGTNQAYADVRRPTADILIPKLDEYALGQLLQMLMLATVVEGRLIGINPYGQPGVEAYKKNMVQILTAGEG
jgi:glucose-6-phosphate isomerase